MQRNRPPILRPELIAAWLFPVLAVAIATLYLGGHLGRSTDDYALNLRDPATGALPSPFNLWIEYPYFWRPLHVALIFGARTLLPTADQGFHLAGALAHAAACLGLFYLLRRLTHTRLAPAAATLLFAVLPFHGEVCFWFPTISTAIATVLLIVTIYAALAYGRCEHTRWPMLPGVFLLALLIPCFYEQAAAPLAALPLFMLADAPTGQQTRERLRRAALATAAAVAACVVYLALMLATAPTHVRAGAGSLITRERLVPRLSELAAAVHRTLLGERAHDILLGSLQLGWDTVASPKGLVLGTALAAAGVLWILWAAHRGGSPTVNDQPATRLKSNPSARPALLLLAGLVVSLAAWLPVYAIDHQTVELRTTYIPLLGLAFMLAAALDALLASLERTAPQTSRALVAAVCVAAVPYGVLGLIGCQRLFQERASRDEQELSQLQYLVPEPPPGAVFVPLDLRVDGWPTGHALFDRARPGVFETQWSAAQAVRHTFRRSDIGATFFNRWIPQRLIAPDETSFGISYELERPWRRHAGESLRIPWSHAIPFIIDPRGRVRLVRTVVIEHPDNRDTSVTPPLVHNALAAHPDARSFEFHVDPDEPGLSLMPLGGWQLAGGAPVQFHPVWAWPSQTRAQTADWLAPGGPRAEMSVQLPPLDRPERLLMRATLAAYDLDPRRNPIVQSVEVVVAMASARDKPIATLRLNPREAMRTRAWHPITATLPPRPPPGGDRLIVSVRAVPDTLVRTDLMDRSPPPPDAAPASLPVWITPGFEQSIADQPASSR